MMIVNFKVVFALFLIFIGNTIPLLKAQDSTAIDIDKIAAIIVLDSFIVTANRNGFEVKDFIRYVLEDKSFYHAFQNLRTVNFYAENEISFAKPSGKIKAKYQSTTQQIYHKPCREMNVLQETTSGKFYKKNGKYNYYTAKMYDRIFFTHGKVCHTTTTSSSSAPKKRTGLEKNVSQLKKLIFQPGHRIDVPFIGNRTAIFEPHMLSKYDYAIISGELNGVDCYIFSVEVKPNIERYAPQKTIIKQMETYFEKETLQVMGRNYHLSYAGFAFAFDVNMDIKLTKKGHKYLPEKISYNGQWSVPFKKVERGKFQAKFRYKNNDAQ